MNPMWSPAVASSLSTKAGSLAVLCLSTTGNKITQYPKRRCALRHREKGRDALGFCAESVRTGKKEAKAKFPERLVPSLGPFTLL